MRFNRDYVERRVKVLFEDIGARKMFRDLDIDHGVRYFSVQIMDDTPMATVTEEDEDFSEMAMDYEEREVRIPAQSIDLTREMYEHDDDPFETFDSTFVHSFTNPIRTELCEQVRVEPLDFETPNEIPFEANIEGRMQIRGRKPTDPDAMLIAGNVAESIQNDSIFEEWEPIERDIEQEFGLDVFVDEFDALFANEILLADRSEMGYELHSRPLTVENRAGTHRAQAGIGYVVTDPDAAIRLAI